MSFTTMDSPEKSWNHSKRVSENNSYGKSYRSEEVKINITDSDEEFAESKRETGKHINRNRDEKQGERSGSKRDRYFDGQERDYRSSDRNEKEHRNESDFGKKGEESGSEKTDTENRKYYAYKRDSSGERNSKERSPSVSMYGSRDERSTGRNDDWTSERNSRDRESSQENLKRGEPSYNDYKDTKDGDIMYEQDREWEFQRNVRGRSGSRKDVSSRSEPVKTSSKFGNSNRNSDVIEIQPKPQNQSYDVVKIQPKPPQLADVQGSGQSGNIPTQFQTGYGNLEPLQAPFRPLSRPPPNPIQSQTPAMPMGSALPPMSTGVFIPPFSQPVLNMLAVPPRALVPQFSPNIGMPPNPALYFNQPNYPGHGFTPAGGPAQQGQWAPPRSEPPGKAPSRGEQYDYSQNFVDTGMRPQNFIRELESSNVVEDYPRLRELLQRKDEIVANSSFPPMYYKCDLREHILAPEFFGTKFDVILVDPPWEEYVHRAPGVTDHMEYWPFEDIMNLKIEAIADTPSFIFLWVGDGVGLEHGRKCLKKWGFRRCEDICWVKTNKTNPTPGLRHDSRTLFQHSKEHCLMGIKGTVRRSTDGHIIHANIDTDVLVSEEPPYGSTAKPEDMYRIIEHFALGKRRLELFGADHNIRSGWLTLGKGLSSSNFNALAYVKNFADKDGKVWQGGAGRLPPPDAPHLVVTTPDIEFLRPKSPLKNQLQLQQQSSTHFIPQQ